MFALLDSQVNEYLKKAEALGWEGLVLRNIGSSIPQDNRVLFKVKGFKENDLTITGYEEGKGHIKGMLGKLVCQGVIDGKGINVKIGGGFTKSGHADSRDALWEMRDQLIGKIVEVKHEGLTEPNKNNTCSLRFARFNKLKEDR
jgi:DNA ligase-1